MLCAKNIIMDKLLQHVYDIENPTNQMLAFRCLCNLMQHEKGELLVVKHHEEFLKFIQNLSQENLSQKQLQVRFFFSFFKTLNLHLLVVANLYIYIFFCLRLL